jgi:hypothetical protein
VHLQDDSHSRFLRLRHGAGYEDAADMTDLFVGRGAGGGKRTMAALASKYVFVNEKGAGRMLYIARGEIH